MVAARARHLIAGGKVAEDTTARVFHVAASHGGTYTVVVGAHRDVCTCAAGRSSRACSHMTAAHLVVNDERNGRDG